MASSAAVPPPGVFVPVPTFFATAGDSATPPLDTKTQCAHTLHLARAGIRGILFLGSTGEAVSLSDDERHEVLSSSRRALDEAGFKGYPIMAGTASYGIEETVQQCKAAKISGADYMMVLAPGFFAKQTTAEGLVRWYTAVADASPLPVMIYNYPGVTNSLTLAPVVFERLAAHSNIVGCKLSHGDLSLLSQVTLSASPHLAPSKFRVFTGLGQQLTPVLSVNGAGAIDGLAGIFPHVVVRLYDVYHQIHSDSERREHLKQAHLDLQRDVSRGEEMIVKWGTVGIKDAISRELGFGARDGTRLPLYGGIPEGGWKEFGEAFEQLRKLEKMLQQHRANVEQKE